MWTVANRHHKLPAESIRRRTGLPDGMFSYQKSKFGYILESLGMKKVGMYSMAIWNILRPFGILYSHLII
jgi:hypothetical protein